MILENIGFLGVGSIALEHAKVINGLNSKVYGAFSKTVNSNNWYIFKKNYPECVFYNCIEKFLSDDCIDGYIVCLPWNVISNYLPLLLACKKPILIEKPVHLNALIYENLIYSYNDKLFNKKVAFNRRYYESVLALKKRILKGGVVSASIVISEDVTRLLKKYGDDISEFIYTYSSCHIIDLALFLFPDLIIENMFHFKHHNNIKSYNGLLSVNNIPLQFSININDPVKIGISVIFDDFTRWSLSPIEVLNVYKDYNIIEPTIIDNIRKYEPKKISSIYTNTKFKPGFFDQMKDFINNKYQNLASLQDFLLVLKFIENIKLISQKK